MSSRHFLRIGVARAAAATAAAIGLLSGCSTYEAPSVNHTYVTNTQDYHELSAVRIVSKTTPEGIANNAFFTGIASEVPAFFIDGRLVLTGRRFQECETLVQLPPGEHELLTTSRVKASNPINGSVDAPTTRITFVLGRSKTMTVTAYAAIIDSINDADSYSVVKAPSNIGITAARPTPSPHETAESADRGTASLETKLVKLKALHTDGLISDEAYQHRVQELLSELK